MISHAHLSNRFWAEAVATATYLRNRSSTTALEEETTPYERWYGRKPNLEYLRVFGCVAYAHIPDCNQRKLDEKAEKLRFVGYSKNPKGYRLYNEKNNKVITRRYVAFDESNFLLSSDANRPDESSEILIVPTESAETETEPLNGTIPERRVRRSERASHPPDRFGFEEHADTAFSEHFVFNVCQVPEPKTIEELVNMQRSGRRPQIPSINP